MRNVTLLLLVVLSVVAIAAIWLDVGTTRYTAPDTPVELPLPISPLSGKLEPFTFTTFEGQTLSTEQFAGKALLLHFWATWCAPCIEELPELLAFAKRHSEKVVLLAITVDKKRGAVERFLAEPAMAAYPALVDAGIAHIVMDTDQDITGKRFTIYQFPETILVNADQRMIAHIKGVHPFWEEESLERLLTLSATLSRLQ